MKKLKIISTSLLVAVAIDSILAWVIMHMWNICMPKMFDTANTIEYWTAFQFLILCAVINLASRISIYNDEV